MKLDSLRLVVRPLVVRVRFKKHCIGMGAVRNDRDNAEQYGENGCKDSDLLPQRIGAFDFVMNFKFGHKCVCPF